MSNMTRAEAIALGEAAYQGAFRPCEDQRARAVAFGKVWDAASANERREFSDYLESVCRVRGISLEEPDCYENYMLAMAAKIALDDIAKRDTLAARDARIAELEREMADRDDDGLGACEGCSEPAVTTDCEGVPLCRSCFDSMVEDGRKSQARLDAQGGSDGK